MSASFSAAAGTSMLVTPVTFTCGVVDTGLFQMGYNKPNLAGTLSPAFFRGSELIVVISSSTNFQDFYIRIDATVPKSFFSSVLVQPSSGGNRTYLSSAAVFTQLGGDSIWEWGDGSDPAWTAAASRVFTLSV